MAMSGELVLVDSQVQKRQDEAAQFRSFRTLLMVSVLSNPFPHQVKFPRVFRGPSLGKVFGPDDQTFYAKFCVWHSDQSPILDLFQPITCLIDSGNMFHAVFQG